MDGHVDGRSVVAGDCSTARASGGIDAMVACPVLGAEGAVVTGGSAGEREGASLPNLQALRRTRVETLTRRTNLCGMLHDCVAPVAGRASFASVPRDASAPRLD